MTTTDTSVDPAIMQEVHAFLARYEACWATKDFAGLEALWDADEPSPMCVPEESLEPLIGWDALRAYWRVTERVIDRIQIKTRDPHVRLVAPNVYALLFEMHWDAQIGPQPPIGNEVRVLAVLGRTPAGLRWRHYAEAPLASMTQMRQFHQRMVSPEFLKP